MSFLSQKVRVRICCSLHTGIRGEIKDIEDGKYDQKNNLLKVHACYSGVTFYGIVVVEIIFVAPLPYSS